MKTKILQMLKDAAEYISGEQISANLGVTRSAVWKVINRLKDEGYVISSISNKGYKLITSPDIIDEASIKSGLNTKLIGQNVYYFESIGSTNEYAKLNSSPNGSVFIADVQTNGKGRLGKNWESQKGTGIWMSIYLKPDIEPYKIMQISLISGIAICNAINAISPVKTQIKWPNDIVINGKKVCGILTEMVSEEQNISYVINGIGVNVNTTQFPEELSKCATSIYLETKKNVSRVTLVQEILTQFEKYYGLLLQQNTLPSLLCEYKNLCLNIGKQVVITSKNSAITATATDISETGELIVTKEDGRTIRINSGEVSVRGVYGYV